MESKLKTEYDTHSTCLLIFESDTSTETKKRLDEKDKQIKEMHDMMQEMKAQILELRLEKLEKINDTKE